MENDRLWGYICCWIAGPEIQILNLAVHPERRRSGLGTRLMEQAVETGTAEGAEGFWLEVRTSNLAAQCLYGGFGFREIGRRPRYYRDTGEDAIVMTLSVPMTGENGSSKLSAVDTRFVSMSTQRSREV
jgi:ribosomal-protein-alanine N-acetyltransferase